MKQYKVVIGSNFGDEGKGLMTDFLAAQTENGIVVRFNGGAQAGHTVKTPDGKRHVFGHFGAGSFAGLPTYLSSFFVVNPMTFGKELAELRALGADVQPVLYVDPNCVVTTPYDIILNQMVENVRGEDRHGSCGLGVYETIVRSQAGPEFCITVRDLLNEGALRQRLHIIRTQYVAIRTAVLGITKVPESYDALLANTGIIALYLRDVKEMLDSISNFADPSFVQLYDTVIFEGAQGLLLDQDYGYKPHVTASNTGMKNVAALLPEMGYAGEEIEVIYVTRSYMTRHGAGPFPTELPEKPYTKIVDETNVPNLHQGALRFGLLDIDTLVERIHGDLEHAVGLNCKAKLAITCLDQIDDEAKYIAAGVFENALIFEFIEDVFGAVGFKDGYLSYGDTRESILPAVIKF